MENKFKRFLSLMLAFLMIISNVPAQAFATEGEVPTAESVSVTEYDFYGSHSRGDQYYHEPYVNYDASVGKYVARWNSYMIDWETPKEMYAELWESATYDSVCDAVISTAAYPNGVYNVTFYIDPATGEITADFAFVRDINYAVYVWNGDDYNYENPGVVLADADGDGTYTGVIKDLQVETAGMEKSFLYCYDAYVVNGELAGYPMPDFAKVTETVTFDAAGTYDVYLEWSENTHSIEVKAVGEEPEAPATQTVKINFYTFIGTGLPGSQRGKHWMKYESQEEPDDVMVKTIEVPVDTTLDLTQYVPFAYGYTFRGWFVDDPWAVDEDAQRDSFTITEDNLAANDEAMINGLTGLHFTAGWSPSWISNGGERIMFSFDNTKTGWETVSCIGVTANGTEYNIENFARREDPNVYVGEVPEEIVKVYFQNASYRFGETPTAVTEMFDVEAGAVYTYTATQTVTFVPVADTREWTAADVQWFNPGQPVEGSSGTIADVSVNADGSFTFVIPATADKYYVIMKTADGNVRMTNAISVSDAPAYEADYAHVIRFVPAEDAFDWEVAAVSVFYPGSSFNPEIDMQLGIPANADGSFTFVLPDTASGFRVDMGTADLRTRGTAVIPAQSGTINEADHAHVIRFFPAENNHSWDVASVSVFWPGSPFNPETDMQLGIPVNDDGSFTFVLPVTASEFQVGLGITGTETSRTTEKFTAASGNFQEPAIAKPPVSVPEVDDVTPGDAAEADKVVIGSIHSQILNNTALNEYVPINIPENGSLEIALTKIAATGALTFQVSPMDANGNKVSNPDEPITFRLPVPESVTKAFAKIFHEDKIFDVVEIKGSGYGKYVEVSSRFFSKYEVVPTDADITFVAEINGAKYETLAAAIAAVQNGETIALLADISESVTIKQAANKSFTIDGNGKTYTGTVSIDGANRSNGAETLTFENVVFNAAKSISGTKSIHNVTFDNCEFITVSGYNFEPGVNYNLKFLDCTVSGTGAFMQAKSATNNLYVENFVAENSGNAFKIDYCSTTGTTATFKNVQIKSGVVGFYISNRNSGALYFENCSAVCQYPLYIWDRDTGIIIPMFFSGSNYVEPTQDKEWFTNESLANITGRETIEIGGKYVAKIGTKGYKTLTEAIAAVQNGETILFVADIAEDVTILQAANKSFTIDGDGKTYSATITIDGNKRSTGAEKLTIQNVNFVAPADTSVAFINTVKSTYVHNLTVDGCTFTGDNKDDIGISLRHCYNITVKNTIAAGMLDLVFGNNNVSNFVAKDITVTDSRNGIWLSYPNGASISNATMNVENCGIYLVNYSNNSTTIADCTISAENPVVLSVAGQKLYGLTFKGTNDLGENWLTIEGNGPAVTVNLTESGLDIEKVTYDANYYGKTETSEDVWLFSEAPSVAAIGETEYKTLAAAIAACVAGDNTITMLTDIDEDVTIQQVKGVNITIDGAGFKYTGTATVNGGNRTTGTDKLIFRNVNFVADSESHISIVAVEKSYVHYLIVDGCTFTGDNKDDIGISLRHVYNITVKNTTASGMLELVYAAKAVTGFTADNVTVTDSTNGFYMGYGTKMTFSNLNLNVTEKGISILNNNPTSTTIEDCTITAKDPVAVQMKNVNNNYTLVLKGENNFTADNWLRIIGTGPNLTVDLTLTESDLDIEEVSYDTNYYGKTETSEDVWLFSEIPSVAAIGETEYKTLAAAIAAVQNGETITLLVDLDESVTIKQAANKSFTIDGDGKTYTGTITIDGNRRSTGAETLTIRNVKFVAEDQWQSSILASKDTYVHNLTVDGCSFEGTDARQAYGIRLYSAYNITVKNTTGKNLFDLVYGQTKVDGFLAENINVTDSVMGFMMPYGMKMTFRNVTLDVSNAGVGIYNNNASSATFENCSIKAPAAIWLEQKTTKSYALTLNGTNTFEGDLWMEVISTNAKFKVTVNDTVQDMTKTSGLAAMNGNVCYNTLAYAMAEDKDGDTVLMLSDVTENAVVDNAITLDLNGKTIDGTMTANAALTVIDTTIPASGATRADYEAAGTITGTVTVAENASLTLYAGNYSADMNQYCAEGFVANKGANIWTVMPLELSDYVAVNEQTGEYYTTASAGLNAAEAGETVKLLKDTQETIVMVMASTKLNLNGKMLTAGYAVLGFGHVVDVNENGVDGEGGIVISADAASGRTSLLAGNEFFPIYDSANGCYRFFTGTHNFIENRGVRPVEGQKNQIKYGMTLRFNNIKAYELLTKAGHGVTVNLVISRSDTNTAAVYTVPEATITTFAKAAVNAMNTKGKVTTAITFTLKRINAVPAGHQIDAYATVQANGTNVMGKSESCSYTVQ